MPRKKDSKAVYYAARFNPKTSEEDAKAIEIIERLKDRGFNFKAIAQDAILRADGVTPEMFSDSTSANAMLIGKIEDILAHFAEELISRMGSLPRVASEADEDSDEYELGETSKFARNFARGFLQRQGKGDQ